MTSVGKVFKPALAMREIEDVVMTVASVLRSSNLSSVSVVQDEARGLLARLAVDGDPTELRTRLGRFNFQIEIRPTSDMAR